MKTIRPNVFETNSSSEHTICFPCASACENLNPARRLLSPVVKVNMDGVTMFWTRRILCLTTGS